ncbi:hypothetical protein NHX12_021256 [Muraenolepis orangiensis]|uniref:Spindle and centriole-associated protein 1 n=1 Tax=Muraenolepis orangiensis TaxID=630683 RepID=A0A9Q0ETD4_9TELE|nr:hypothetical protein NHX12_021256 [Muraenolepis orangiensis]
MSFMKPGRPQLSSGRRSTRPKKPAPKREWVSTVNDLSVHKLSPAEQSHRHEAHKSHNTVVAQWELKEKALRRHHKHLGSPRGPMDQASLSIIREDVLARSDKAMAVVKDLFGDAPRRHTGHPSVTMAPDCDSDSELPVVQRADPPTQLSLLSQSTMNQQALNELEVSEEELRDEEENRPTAGANPMYRANLRKMKTKTTAGRGPQRPRARPNSRYHGLGEVDQTTPCAPGRVPGPAALNATISVQRVRTRSGQSEGRQEAEPDVHDSRASNLSGRSNAAPCRQRKTSGLRLPETSGQLDGSAVQSLSGNQSSLDLLQSMLGRVEADLDSLGLHQEPEREGQPSAEAEQTPRTQGLTGFSVALVSTLGRLVHLLKQRDEEAQREARERSRLEEELQDQRGLIDALTAESLALREESAALQVGLQQRTSELEQRLDTMVLALGGLDLLGPHNDSYTQDLTHSRITDYGSASPYPEYEPRAAQVPVSSALLLSPPQQRDNLHHSPDGTPAQSYVGSRHSLPSSSSLPADLEGRPSLSENAMVAEITRLSQQNEHIKAQLTQTRALGSVLSRSPDSASTTSVSTTASRSRGSFSSSGSAGRGTAVPAQEVVRRGSAGPERQTQQVHLTGGEELCSPEAAGSCVSTGSSVEQRLLELNRQSAAARGRLLELIEQQKRTHTQQEDGPPSRPSRCLTRRGPRAAVGPGGEWGSRLGGGRAKPDKLREAEGWFALSSHVR